MFKVLEGRREYKGLWTEWQHAFPKFNLLLTSWMQFSLVTVVPNYMNFVTFSKDSLAVSKLWFCRAFWWQDTTLYLVFSLFTSTATFLLASNKISVSFYGVQVLIQNINVVSIDQELMWIQSLIWRMVRLTLKSYFQSRCMCHDCICEWDDAISH